MSVGLGVREDIAGGTTGRLLRLDIMENFLGVRAACTGREGQVQGGSPTVAMTLGTHCNPSGVRPRLCIFPRALQTFGACEGLSELPRQQQRLQSEWKMAKIVLLVIFLFVLSWAPYSTVALMAFSG